jgi:hypothetical protein
MGGRCELACSVLCDKHYPWLNDSRRKTVCVIILVVDTHNIRESNRERSEKYAKSSTIFDSMRVHQAARIKLGMTFSDNQKGG